MIRSTNFDLFLADRDLHRKIVDSIRLYRAVCRQAFSVCAMAEISGATIEYDEKGIRVKSNSEAASRVLADTFGKEGKAHLYQLRDFVRTDLAPTWLSYVWDSLRADVSSRWRAKDPEITKATKGFLVLQGARALNRFMRIGIGMPHLTAHPKIEKHEVTVKWDHIIGPVIFRFGKLDGGRYHILKGIRDNLPGWKLGTIYLNEHEGKLRLTMSYECPDLEKSVDPVNVMEITFTDVPSQYITVKGPGNLEGDYVSAEEAMGLLQQLNIKRERWEGRRTAVGNPRKAWGSKTMWDATQKVISNVTEHRSNAVKTRNHLWTRRIIEDAKRWQCGTIVVNNMPERAMFGEPWNWSQFQQFLDYKIKEVGGTAVYKPKEELKAA